MYRALGTLLQRATKVPSHTHTGVIGNNNAILWTTVTEGTAGDLVNIHIVDPGGTAALSIVVVGVAIHINLATTTGTIISTATQVMAAIEASPAASALVLVTSDGASTGAGVMVAQAETFLASGSDTETYTTIAEVGDIGGPALKQGTMETTSHSSASGWREFITTVKEAGDVTFPISFLPANVTHNEILGLIKDYRTGTLRKMQIVFTDTGTMTCSFSAYVTGFTPAMPVEGKLSSNLTVKISGAVVWTP